MDWYNDAERFEEDYEYTFTELPLAGRLSKSLGQVITG